MQHYKNWKKKRHLRNIPEDIKNPSFSAILDDKKEVTKKTSQKSSVKTSFDKTFKIIIIGNTEVGKHTLLKNHTKKVISRPALNVELGIEFHTKSILLEGKLYNLQVWSFKDYERFMTFFSTYGKGSVAAIFIFDITRIHSLQNYEKWFTSLRDMIPNPDQYSILLVGNKKDLTESRQVLPERAIDIAKANKLNGYLEISAKTGENVDEAFKFITRLIVSYSTLVFS